MKGTEGKREFGRRRSFRDAPPVPDLKEVTTDTSFSPNELAYCEQIAQTDPDMRRLLDIQASIMTAPQRHSDDRDDLLETEAQIRALADQYLRDRGAKH